MSASSGFGRIIGQELAKRVLSKAVREGRPAHAYLFLGLQGTGKLTTALEFGKALSCENRQDGSACGECAVCRSIEHGNFPDMRVWSPERQDTAIKHMREMRDLASFRPARGKWTVNIIEQGDTLNEDSASCILKLLEEPPPYVVNILLYRNASNVLPTIRSRCRLVRFEQATTEELSARLVDEHGVGADEAAFLAAYSQGRPGIAIGLIGDGEFRRRRENVASVASVAASGDAWAALALAEALRSGPVAETDDDDQADEDEESPAQDRAAARMGARRAVLESLGMLLLWYRDLLAVKLQGEQAAIVNSDMRDGLLEQSSRYRHSGPLLGAVEAILRARRRIQGNGIPQIVTEALMMKLAQSFG